MTKWRIVPYQTKHEPALLRLEAAAPQGSRIRLEMLRGCFRDRSEVFDQFGIFLAVSESDDVLGVIAGSVVLLERNGIPERVGYLYDLRVARDYRRIGIARSLGAHLLREYFPSLAVDRCISTVKAENQPAIRALRRIVKTGCHYPFTYLTIPTGIRTCLLYTSDAADE